MPHALTNRGDVPYSRRVHNGDAVVILLRHFARKRSATLLGWARGAVVSGRGSLTGVSVLKLKVDDLT